MKYRVTLYNLFKPDGDVYTSFVHTNHVGGLIFMDFLCSAVIYHDLEPAKNVLVLAKKAQNEMNHNSEFERTAFIEATTDDKQPEDGLWVPITMIDMIEELSGENCV